MCYKTLQDKNDLWKIGTSILKEKQAIIVLLESLECNVKAEKVASELTAANFNKENDMTILIKNSNKKTGNEIVDETYLTYLKD